MLFHTFAVAVVVCVTSSLQQFLDSGNGTTSAVQLLIDCLGLKHYTAPPGDGDDLRPLIILGPMEHHSNILPWRELGGDNFLVVTVKYDAASGGVDMADLEGILSAHRHRPVKIGTFTAASNLTGTVADDLAVTALLHKHGALAFWDYATGASHLEMNMNPTGRHLQCYNNSNSNSNNDNSDAAAGTTEYDPSLIAKDAIFFSGHKLLGGVASPGVLIVKKRLVSSLNPPDRCGGGTVFYVTADHHRFLSDRVERFEGGTPNITGIWRLGLVFRLKMALAKKVAASTKMSPSNASSPSITTTTTSPLLVHDLERAQKIQRELQEIPNLVLLDGHHAGNKTTATAVVHKLPIFSFLVKCGTRFLHYNYVCAILNDVFGIQARGGCQCAGPYAQHMLGLVTDADDDGTGGASKNCAVEDWLVRTKDELLRPGVTRLSLPTLGTTREQEGYVVGAVRWVAMHGWKLLHVYRCNHRTGEWRHKSRPGSPLGTDRRWLSHMQLPWLGDGAAAGDDAGNGRPAARDAPVCGGGPGDVLAAAMANADAMLEVVMRDQSSLSQASKMAEEDESTAASALRWYVYPKVRGETAAFSDDGLVL
jgi:selenocysteine lyase/cysteine desulfurase